MNFKQQNSRDVSMTQGDTHLTRSDDGRHQILHLRQGEAELFINRQHRKLSDGGTLLLHPEDLVRFAFASENLQFIDIRYQEETFLLCREKLLEDFDFFSIDGVAPGKPAGKRGRLALAPPSPAITRLIDELSSEFMQQPPNWHTRIQLLLTDLLILLARGAAEGQRQSANAAVNYIDYLIETRFGTRLDLDLLEDRTKISKSRLCRLYRSANGQTIMDSLRIRRLNEAAELLTSTNSRISEISRTSGFSELSYFYRAFVQKFGSNPGEFRRKFRSN